MDCAGGLLIREELFREARLPIEADRFRALLATRAHSAMLRECENDRIGMKNGSRNRILPVPANFQGHKIGRNTGSIILPSRGPVTHALRQLLCDSGTEAG